MLINVWGIHHDPAHWPQPDAFRPERFLAEGKQHARGSDAFLGFGFGETLWHSCGGCTAPFTHWTRC